MLFIARTTTPNLLLISQQLTLLCLTLTWNSMPVHPSALQRVRRDDPSSKRASGHQEPVMGKCIDQLGEFRDDQEEWAAGDSWHYKCIRGRKEITGCVATKRANFQVIPLNASVIVNGFWHNCTDSDGFIKYAEEGSCQINGKELHVNQTFRSGNSFVMVCQPWGYDIIACFYKDQDGSFKELAVGSEVVVGRFKHACKRLQNSSRVEYDVEANSCEYEGKTFEKGESWYAGNFKVQCGDYGAYQTVACRYKDQDIAVNSTVEINGVTVKCVRNGNTVSFFSSGSIPSGQKSSSLIGSSEGHVIVPNNGNAAIPAAFSQDPSKGGSSRNSNSVQQVTVQVELQPVPEGVKGEVEGSGLEKPPVTSSSSSAVQIPAGGAIQAITVNNGRQGAAANLQGLLPTEGELASGQTTISRTWTGNFTDLMKLLQGGGFPPNFLNSNLQLASSQSS